MKQLLATIVLVFTTGYAFSQQDSLPAATDIDPSKPTNLYTQVNLALENQSGNGTDVYGIRTNIQYAPNADNLFVVEVPVLYNSNTSSFGISDPRVRYFKAVKRNISPRFIAIAPFADVSIPLGSYKNGLGSSSWSVAGGVVFGYVVSKKLALFPGISYVHITEQGTDLIPKANKFSSNGVGLQLNGSYSFNKSTFLFVNPTPTFLNVKGNWKTYWSGEMNLNKIIVPNKLKVNAYWSPNFTTEVHTVRVGGTFFL